MTQRNSPGPNRPGALKSDSAADIVASEIRSRAEELDDPRIFEVVTEYEEALRAGDQPKRSNYINRHPELASAVAACLDGIDLVYADKPHVARRGDDEPRHNRPVTDDSQQPLGMGAAPLGDYRIVRELARGGMGVVYEAIQLSLGRRVALKVLPFAATIDERHLQRFKLEAQAAALLHHNHIVPVYAVGCERGVHYYAMQLIDGQSLSVVIRQLSEQADKHRTDDSASQELQDRDPDQTASAVRGGAQDANRPRRDVNIRVRDPQQENARPDTAPELSAADRQREREHAADLERDAASTLDVSHAVTAGFTVRSERYVRRAARLIQQAAEALEHAHQAGVVHRDVKPANLLVDKSGRIWVTDFGLAQIQADLSLTRSGDMLGTLRYMSPEQAGGQSATLDHRTDVYSLGATFYELLTLQPVFGGETHQELLYQILHDEPRGLREKNRAIPAELETIVLKAISKNPGERYQTAQDFAADIQRFLEHQPILARRPTLLDRTKKWSRRHPSVVVASGLLLAVIAVALLISNWMISEEQSKTQAAYQLEKQRRAEAEQSFLQARDAVRALFEISEEELAGQGQDAARRKILEVVLSHYEEFIDQRQNDPAGQAELERDQQTVERILHELTVIQQSMRLRLLDDPSVRKDLDLDEEQRQALAGLAVQRWTIERELYAEAGEALTEDERRQQIVANAEAHEAQVKEILTENQTERFNQISVQFLGLAAFKEPEIVQALGLTNRQREQIREIERATFARRGPSRGGGPGGRGRGGGDFGGRGRRGGGGRPSLEDRDTAVNRVLEILNPEQRATWDALVGEPFEGFDEMDNRRQRRGPPRNPEDDPADD